jgi:hypothetical protein
MRYQALATDYDSTLADSGRVGCPTLDALDRVRASGRKLILVTGRELPDLLDVFPQVDLFNRVVAENGALLFNPESLEQTLLAEPLPGSFLSLLRARQVPFAQGRVILATDSQHESAVSQLIGQLDLDLHIVLNKGSVMVLPSAVDKLMGLQRALDQLQLSLENLVGIGDAENDRAFLSACGCAVAVANALPDIRDLADIVTALPAGRGVVELIDRLLANDIALCALRRGE